MVWFNKLFLFGKSTGLMLSWSKLAWLPWTRVARLPALGIYQCSQYFCAFITHLYLFIYLFLLFQLLPSGPCSFAFSEQVAMSLLSLMGKWGYLWQRWQSLRLKYSYLFPLWFFQSPWTEITAALAQKARCSCPYMLVYMALAGAWQNFRFIRYIAALRLKGNSMGTMSLMYITSSIVSSVLYLWKALGIGIPLGNCYLSLSYRLHLFADRSIIN